MAVEVRDASMLDGDRVGHGGGAPSKSAFSHVRPDLLGFTFHLAWLCLFMYNVIPGFVGSSEDSYDALNPVYFYSMLSLIVVLIFGISRTHSFMSFAHSKLGRYGMPLICSLGTLFYALCAMGVVNDGVAAALVVAGGVMTGSSSAVMAAHWASIFGRAKARAVIMNFTLIIAAVLVACLTVSYLFPTMALILATLLPLASGASLVYADGYKVEGDGTKEPRCQGAKASRHSRKAYIILIAAVALFGFSTGGLGILGSNEIRYEELFYSTTSAIVLIAVGWLVVQEDKHAFLPLFVAPLLVLAVFALPYVRFTSNDAAGLFFTTGIVAIELMLVFEAVLFALLFDFSCARTFMIARMTYAISNQLSWLLSNSIVGTWGTSVTMQIAGTAILAASEIVIAALVVTYMLLRKKTGTTPELNTRAAGVEGNTHDASNHATPTNATDDTANRDANERQGEPAMCPAKSIAANAASSEPQEGQTSACVGLAAERYGLSPRETDVLRLLVAGDSTAQIQDKLCIAPGTFNYHMRNIYAKLGVHSRQELLIFIYSQAKQ